MKARVKHAYINSSLMVSPRFLCRPTAFFRLAGAVAPAGRKKAVGRQRNIGLSYGLPIFHTFVLLVNSMYFDLKYVFHTDLQTPVLTQIGKGSKQSVLMRRGKKGGRN